MCYLIKPVTSIHPFWNIHMYVYVYKSITIDLTNSKLGFNKLTDKLKKQQKLKNIYLPCIYLVVVVILRVIVFQTLNGRYLFSFICSFKNLF